MSAQPQPPSQPLNLLGAWLKEAQQRPVSEPWAMVLSTSAANEVSSRVVLLKKTTQQGHLFFYTNYQSQKGFQLEQNPKAALNFHWDDLDRQLRLQGVVKKASREESERYWKSRPRGSQLSQYFSLQSQRLPETLSLKEAHRICEENFRGKEIPCPENWGGYEFTSHRIEFWQRGENRLHHRWNYEWVQGRWQLSCLYP